MILAALFWIAIPFFEEVSFGLSNLKNNNGDHGVCDFRLEDESILISDTTFFSNTGKFQLLITNDGPRPVSLERVAKTYEFRFDSSGETEVEELKAVVQPKDSVSVSFFVEKEPHILGLEFSGCKKKKVSDWFVATEE